MQKNATLLFGDSSELNTSRKTLITPRSNRKTTNEYIVKHKQRRANPDMIQAILCITRSINLCRQIVFILVKRGMFGDSV